MYQKEFMEEAISLSRKCLETGKGGPFGAVVVKEGVVVGRGSNAVTVDNDPTAHAEIIAIRNACKELNTFQLVDCEIYSSCEPCPMCLGAIYWARPKALYFTASREDAAMAGFDDSLIYDEIGKDAAHRQIPTQQIPNKDAVEVFNAWRDYEEKIEY